MTYDPRTATLAEIVSEGRFLSLDIEGTGNNPQMPVEIAILTVENGTVVDRWHRIVNPGWPISPYATRIHGLADEDVGNAPSLTSILPELRAILTDAVIVGHAAEGDIGTLRNVIPDVDFLPARVIDTLRFSKAMLRELPSHRLELVRDALDLEWEDPEPDASGRSGPHSAIYDAAIAAKAFLALVQRIPDDRKAMKHFSQQATIQMSAKKEAKLREALAAREDLLSSLETSGSVTP